MKACRVIKIIAFVLALLFTAVAIAGNVLVIKTAEDYKGQGVTVTSIIEELKTADFKILPEKTAAAEEAVSTESTDAVSDLVPAASEQPAAEPTAEVTAEPTAEPTAVPDTAPAEETAKPAEYKLDNYHYLLITLMKAATHRFEVKFLTNATICGSQPFVDHGFNVNTCVAIAFGLLFLCFILHCISKKVAKTFYGIILMILGYVLFVVFVFAGQYIANAAYTVLTAFDNYDQNLVRISLVTLSSFLAVFFGLPYYRCGSRQMRMKEYKNTIKRLKRRAR